MIVITVMNNIGKSVYDDFVPPYPLNLRGWLGDTSVFHRLIEKHRPEVIIEVGTWTGSSAVMMANKVKEMKLNCKIYCVDTWLGVLQMWDDTDHRGIHKMPEADLLLKNGYPQIYYQFLSNIVHTNHQDVIIPIPLPANLAAKLLLNKNIKSSLIYIDGSHEEDDVYDDMTNYYKLLNPGGVMIGDDYTWQSVKDGVKKFVTENNWSPSVIKEESVNWILEKPLTS